MERTVSGVHAMMAQLIVLEVNVRTGNHAVSTVCVACVCAGWYSLSVRHNVTHAKIRGAVTGTHERERGNISVPHNPAGVHIQ